MNWIDIIPALPLARGVPVRTRGGGRHAFTALVEADYGKDGGGVELVSMYPHYTQRHYRWRVDLDDPQGFAYALRTLYMLGGDLPEHVDTWVSGCTITDADRVALAKALRDVTPQAKTRTTEA